MNLRGLQDYLTNGKAISVGTPNIATLDKAPQLNTTQITAASFNAGVTGAGITAFTNMPFYLTDLGPTGVPFVDIKQAVTGHSVMTNLTFTRLPFLVSNTTGISFGTLKLLSMPFGRFAFCGGTLMFTSVNASVNNSVVQTTGVAGSAIDAAFSGDFALGTAATANATLSSTKVDIVASTAFLDPAVSSVTNNLATPGTVVNGPTEFDGSTTTTTGTAKTVNLNLIIDDEDVADTNAACIFLTGFLRIYTQWLGDF